MPQRSAIVVVVDRLGAGFLGPYGNTWLETSQFNRLASESLLCEQALADSPCLDSLYRSYWLGLHALCPTALATGPALPEFLAPHGVASTLLTDEPSVAQHPLALGFENHVLVPPQEARGAATDVEQTRLLGFFAEAADWLGTAQTPFLLWAHAQGMSGPWDAPVEFRRQFADEDDPEPPEFVAPPSLRLTAGFDPDAAWGMVQAYAGQVALLDLGLGLLLDALAASPAAESTLLVVTSPRGYPLGEHLRVGAMDEALYGELLHVPLLLRFPDGSAALRRTQALVQPPDLFATLADWFGRPTDPAVVWGRSIRPLMTAGPAPLRDRACAALGLERAIRTPAWFMRQAAQNCKLFVEPDDRWEVNDVATRCGSVVEELVAALNQLEQAAQTTPFFDPPPLSAVLAGGLD